MFYGVTKKIITLSVGYEKVKEEMQVNKQYEGNATVYYWEMQLKSKATVYYWDIAKDCQSIHFLGVGNPIQSLSGKPQNWKRKGNEKDYTSKSYGQGFTDAEGNLSAERSGLPQGLSLEAVNKTV